MRYNRRMPPRRRLTVPYRRQQTEYTCGPASLSMVLSFFKKPARQHSLARLMRTNAEIGTETRYMIRAATRAGFYCYVNNDSSFDEVRWFLSIGLPVIIRFIEPNENADHYAVAKGYQKDGLILHDPWNGRNTLIPFRSLKKRWHDRTGDHRAWMMVLSPEDFRLGKQYRPTALKR